jgi:hypothetical protein
MVLAEYMERPMANARISTTTLPMASASSTVLFSFKGYLLPWSHEQQPVPE